MPLSRRFEENTSAELAAMRAELGSAVAILPVAATEQHGAHLPLGTDAMIGEAMAGELLAHLPETLAATLLPVQRVGASDEHLDFAGTLSLGSRLTADLVERIGLGLLASGFRRLVVISSHGGNTPAVEIAALSLRRAGLLCATASWNRFGLPDGCLPEEEVAVGIHAGAVETAVMMHFHPALVRAGHVADNASLQATLAVENRYLRAHGRLGFAWLAGDLNAGGAVGDARLASAELGARIARHQAEGCARFVAEVARLDLSRLVQTAGRPPISRTDP